jgi:hypothetical protein
VPVHGLTNVDQGQPWSNNGQTNSRGGCEVVVDGGELVLPGSGKGRRGAIKMLCIV